MLLFCCRLLKSFLWQKFFVFATVATTEINFKRNYNWLKPTFLSSIRFSSSINFNWILQDSEYTLTKSGRRESILLNCRIGRGWEKVNQKRVSSWKSDTLCPEFGTCCLVECQNILSLVCPTTQILFDLISFRLATQFIVEVDDQFGL